MALNYLLSPEFQIVNSAGRPATNGYLEVYYHGTRDRYYCASDFNGTLHPFQVPLDSLGGNVVLADDSHAYDVYIYNRYGSLLMSRYNIHPSSGGSMGGVITSSDGSVTVTPTQDGWDLSVDDGKAATFRAAADSLTADGYFSFRKIEGEGEAIYLDNGAIKMDDGWYHFSATVKLTWYGANVNDTSTVRLYSGATYDVIDFDYSYNHSDTVVLDGDIWIGAHSTHYISFGRNFSLGVTGMRQGMVAELVDCDLHSIIGQGVGGNGEKNIHRLLRYYTNANEADAQHPAGDWLHDLDAEDPADPSRHPMVTADQLFAWYDEGQIFDLYEVDGSNGQLGWSAVYRMVTWQDQSAWWSQDAPVPGKACRLEFYRSGMYSVPNRVGLIAYIRYKDEDYMRLYEIMPGQSVWMMEFQEALPYYGRDTHNGEFLRVKADGSGLEWVAMDLSDYVTETDLQSALSGKQDTLTAGSNITISGSTISATDTTYTAGTGLSLTGTEFSADTSVLATQSDLAGKQDTLTAGTGITIQNNVISATAAQQVQSNWNETDTADPSYIQNKPDLSIYAESANLATVATTGDYDDLTDKPDLSVYAEKADLATVATTGDYTDLTNKPTIPTVDQVYDGTSTNAQSGTAVAGAISTKQDTISDLNTIRSGAQAGSTAVQPGDLATVATTGSYTDLTNKPDLSVYAETADLATVATTGSYDDLSNKPDLSVYAETADLATVATTGDYDDLTNKPTIPAAQVNSDWNASSGVAQILNKPDLSVYATQSDLNDKQDTLTAGSNITIINNVISATDTTYTAGTGISISNQNEISNSDPLPAHTSSDEGKVLKVDSNGDLEWGAESGGTVTDVQVNGVSVVSGGVADITVPAQVNSDWNASSGVAEILNKPTEKTLAAGSNVTITEANDTVTISATNTTYTAGTGVDITSGVISADTSVLATQNDLSSKQDTLTAGSNITISNNTISATDTTYSAGTGLTLTGTTFSNSDPIPAHTSSDSGKVLSVDSNGDTVWDTPAAAQVNSDWTATSGVAEILHKPTEKTLVAGTNVTITEANDTVTISSTDTTYTAGNNITISGGVISAASQVNADWNESDTTDPSYIENKPDLSVYATTSAMNAALADKQDTLTAGTNVSISNNVISATDTTYTAGTGIDISNNEISVETPVDIVAGPGIVIDNPDGNTLRVSVAQDVETVLWSGSPTNSVTLSENMNNFECIDVYERWDNANANATVHRIYMEGKTTAVINFSIGANTWYLVVQKLDLNGTTLSVNSVHSIHGSSYTSTDIIHESNTTLLKNTIIKVVGIHRIANN